MAGPFAKRSKPSADQERKILPTAEEIAAKKTASTGAVKTAKPAPETRSQKIIIYVTPSDKEKLAKAIGRKSESKELYPIIKKYIDSLSHRVTESPSH